eukprot:CAMPEP_0172736928 /NCGR_PEP_ID=MMETSP1074-20121228/116380_1 /TAXON_ID=2916 /ORGANISM="Ceratium fusus, Strain PA161109" /LENGTH=49 /DNA_ID= /DNA_START= /DNA_END= /DNA_ORIENTATION=
MSLKSVITFDTGRFFAAATSKLSEDATETSKPAEHSARRRTARAASMLR